MEQTPRQWSKGLRNGTPLATPRTARTPRSATPRSTPRSLRIAVSAAGGNHKFLSVCLEDTIEQVRKACPSDEDFDLAFGSSLLCDSETVADSGIKAGSILTLVRREPCSLLTTWHDKIDCRRWKRGARLIDVQSGLCKCIFDGHSKTVTSAVCSRDGSLVLTASEDGTARLFRAKTGSCEQVYTCGSSLAFAIFSPDCHNVLTVAHDGMAGVYQTESGVCQQTLKCGGPVSQACFSADNSTLLIAASTAQTYSTSSWKCTQLGAEGVLHASFSPSGEKVLVSLKASAEMYDVKTAECKQMFDGHTSPVIWGHCSAAGNLVLTGSSDGSVKVFDASTAGCIWSFADVLPFSASSPDGKSLLLASEKREGEVQLIDLASGHCKQRIHSSGAVTGVAFSPSASRILVTHDGKAAVFDRLRGICIRTLPGYANADASFSFAP